MLITQAARTTPRRHATHRGSEVSARRPSEAEVRAVAGHEQDNQRVSTYDPSGWQELGVAVAGASAALTGLVFVAVSINLDRILAYPWLSGRVGETVLLLMAVLVESLLVLAPGQSRSR
jgi:hypothetical protein